MQTKCLNYYVIRIFIAAASATLLPRKSTATEKTTTETVTLHARVPSTRAAQTVVVTMPSPATGSKNKNKNQHLVLAIQEPLPLAQP